MRRFHIAGNSIKLYTLYALLILLSMNYSQKFFYFAFGAFAWVWITNRYMAITSSMIPYFALSLLIGATHAANGTLAMLRPLSYGLLYCVGYNTMIQLPNKHKEEVHEEEMGKLRGIFFSIAVGSFLHLLFNFVNNWGKTLGRNTIDIWSGEIMSATQQATLGCIMVGYSVYLIFSSPTKIGRIAGWGAALSMLAYNLVLSGRTLVAMYMVLFGMGTLYLLYSEKFATKRLKIIGYSILICITLLVIYISNFGGIRTTIEASNLYQRFFVEADLGIFETSRSDAKTAYLQNLYRYPFGGLHMRDQYGYAHDLLLDGYDEFGLPVAVLLIYVLFRTIRTLFQMIRTNELPLPFKMCLLCVYSAVHIQFFIEPILAGMQWLFVCYCLMNGCMDGLKRNLNLGYRRI